MKSNIKFILILSSFFITCHVLNASHIMPTLMNTENMYIRIFDNSTGSFIEGGITITGAGNNWFDVMEISGGYYQETSNGLPTGMLSQYNTSVLLKQRNALTSLLVAPLLENHSLKVEFIFMGISISGALEVAYQYTLDVAQLESMHNINSKDFEVKTVRLDFVSQTVEQEDLINSVTSMLTF